MCKLSSVARRQSDKMSYFVQHRAKVMTLNLVVGIQIKFGFLHKMITSETFTL